MVRWCWWSSGKWEVISLWFHCTQTHTHKHAPACVGKGYTSPKGKSGNSFLPAWQEAGTRCRTASWLVSPRQPGKRCMSFSRFLNYLLWLRTNRLPPSKQWVDGAFDRLIRFFRSTGVVGPPCALIVCQRCTVWTPRNTNCCCPANLSDVALGGVCEGPWHTVSSVSMMSCLLLFTQGYLGLSQWTKAIAYFWESWFFIVTLSFKLFKAGWKIEVYTMWLAEVIFRFLHFLV